MHCIDTAYQTTRNITWNSTTLLNQTVLLRTGVDHFDFKLLVNNTQLVLTMVKA